MIKINNRSIVYQDIKKKIARGIFQPGSPLPSLRLLSDKYDTSVGTVRQALDQLRIEGAVESRHGKGNYVSEPQIKTRNVMLIAQLSGDLFQELAGAFSSIFNSHPECHLLLEQTPQTDPPEAALMLENKIQSLIKDNNLDAIFFDGTDFYETGFLKKYVDDVNIYCFYNPAKLEDFMCRHVTSDWFHGGFIGIRHLLDIGCEKLLVITHQLDLYKESNVVNSFLAGCRQAANDSNIDLVEMHHQAEDEDYAEKFYQIMLAHPEIDGVFAFGDFRMRPLYPVLRKLGKKIGRDIAALGYYDTQWARAYEPELSSVNVKPEKIISVVCDLYFNNNAGNNYVRIPPEIIVRESSSLNVKQLEGVEK